MILLIYIFISGNIIFVCNGCLRTPTVDSAPSIVLTTTTMETISCGANPCPPVPPGIVLGPDVTATGPSVTGTPPSCTFSYTLRCTRPGVTELAALGTTSDATANPTTFTCDGTSTYTYNGGVDVRSVNCR